MASTDAMPVPRKNTAYRHYFTIRKNDGTLITSWASADSERSLDGAAYADCTNEATEIGTSGTGYIDLTAAEMDADCTLLKVTVTNTNALPLVVALFPQESGDIQSTTEAIAANAVTAVSIDNDAITAAKIASNAIGASQVATDAATEIANQVWGVSLPGLYTSGQAGGILNDVLADTSTTLPDLFPANFSSLVITAGGVVDADIEFVNGVEITGDGNATPWGPA